MNDERSSQRLILLVAASGAAALVGVVLGLASKSAGWGLAWFALPVGLSAGLVVTAAHTLNTRERVMVGGLAAMLGLAVLAWAGHDVRWHAAADVDDHEQDELCVRVVALQTCHEQKLMGVFDFNDVPEPICAAARQRVADMPSAEKLALLDHTFGERINDSTAAETSSLGSLLRHGAWGALAVTGAIVPIGLCRCRGPAGRCSRSRRR